MNGLKKYRKVYCRKYKFRRGQTGLITREVCFFRKKKRNGLALMLHFVMYFQFIYQKVKLISFSLRMGYVSLRNVFVSV